MLLNRLLIIINFLALLYLAFLVAKTRKNALFSAKEKKNGSFLGEKCIQKVSLHRFNPFNELGGNQSFVLVLLDSDNSGIIVTSLHGRKNTRIYSKRVKNGKADGITLSKEEELAIKKALKVS
ncbi:DUF4446 family protein [Patescibacteria group bacterium]|nr:DUF4446 family protein [Patescibacteria group bacterium]MCG2702407.1 DUF4446 family protein [Candidatus Parcubacteria bacterium]MBU4264543.1 DUF4446 family protein [Patescibacteria group bacterium]MBU4390474.1 DUF4446 family protein [Patescibacteria group bacterium]MBU4397390.1 DUF4446 family protein [Patescibacteria group bacterium]